MIALITGNLWRAACAFLAGLVVVLWVQLHGLPVLGGGALAKLEIAQAALDKIDNAQKQATIDQVAVSNEPARTSAAISEVSDAQAPDYFDRVRRASAGSVRPKDKCSPSAPDLPVTDRSAEVDDRNASASELVSVTAGDYDQITAAAGQAAMCARAGQALIASGVAVEGDE